MIRLFFICLSLVTVVGLGVDFTFQTPPPQSTDWISNLDTYTKLIGGIIAGLGALFGLPVAFMQIRKTSVEIRKLELEAAELQAKGLSTNAGFHQGANTVVIENSQDVSVQILADPRFLGPLLLLLDFIIAYVVITLADYALDLFVSGWIRTVLSGIVIALLLVPILGEAVKVRKNLRTDNIPSSTSS